MKKLQSLILIGLFLSILAVAVLSSLFNAASSTAQELDEFNYLPYIIQPGEATIPTRTPTPIPQPEGIIYVDHNSVALFDQIPAQYLQAAAAMHMIFVDRSVGSNISDGLTCLNHPHSGAPSHCTQLDHPNPEFVVDPSEISWTGTYNRANWDYRTWPDVGPPDQQVDCQASTGEWYGKLECFIEFAGGVTNNYDVLSFQFSYLEVAGGTIAHPTEGFFANTPGYDIHEWETFAAQHSDKFFIYWTTSLARSIGTQISDDFNAQMRQYAIENDKILFDVADILSHAPDGTPCYDNRGDGYLAICQHYTTEANGGHLGSVSAGKIRVAKAFWVLMAQIAGWNPHP